MILDWAKQCKKIHTTKEISRDDPADNKQHYAQEIVYLCYLRYVLKKTEVECYKEWKEIKNGVASVFKDDEEQLLIEFNSMYKKTNSKRYMSLNYTTELDPVTIYNAEILFLNRVNAPIWVKQYWLCLLVYYKFMAQRYNRVQKTKTLNAWAIRQSEYKHKDYGGICQDQIARYNKTIKKPAILDYTKISTERYSIYKPGFLKTKGKVKCTCNDINDIQQLFTLLKSNYKKCDICGKKFEVNSKTKRTICEKCYRKYRIQRIIDYVQNKEQK